MISTIWKRPFDDIVVTILPSENDNDGEGNDCDCDDGYKGINESGADCGTFSAVKACAQPACLSLIYHGDSDDKRLEKY